MTTNALPAPQSLLPRRARGDRPLLVIMAVMAFLAGLALLTAIWGTRAGDIWTSDLEGRMTVQVMDPAKAEAALDVIEAQSGTSGRILDTSETDALLSPWLGNAALPDDIAVPALISVDGTLATETLAGALEAAGITAEVDDHQRWANQVGRTAFWVRSAALGVLAIILLAGAATSGFATEAAMRAEETVVRVLGQVGAQDKFVSRLFVKRFFFLGLKAGVVGSVAAGVFGLMLGVAFGEPFGVGMGGLFWLAVLPILSGLIAAGAAGFMALAQLKSDRATR